MTRFYFDSSDFPDQEGIEFDCPARALREAVKAAGEAIRDMREPSDWQMILRDEAGNELCRLSFSVSGRAASLRSQLSSPVP